MLGAARAGGGRGRDELGRHAQRVGRDELERQAAAAEPREQRRERVDLEMITKDF